MSAVVEWVKNLPTPVRHFVLLFVSVAAVSLAQNVAEVEGVSALDLATAVKTAVDAAFTAVAGVVIAALTPLTAKYGAFTDVED